MQSLFQDIPVETTIEKVKYVSFSPKSGLEGTLEFVIPGTGNGYIDLARTRLLIHLKMVQKDGSNLPVADAAENNPWFKQLVAHNLFRQVDVSL